MHVPMVKTDALADRSRLSLSTRRTSSKVVVAIRLWMESVCWSRSPTERWRLEMAFSRSLSTVALYALSQSHKYQDAWWFLIYRVEFVSLDIMFKTLDILVVSVMIWLKDSWSSVATSPWRASSMSRQSDVVHWRMGRGFPCTIGLWILTSLDHTRSRKRTSSSFCGYGNNASAHWLDLLSVLKAIATVSSSSFNASFNFSEREPNCFLVRAVPVATDELLRLLLGGWTCMAVVWLSRRRRAWESFTQ